MTNNFKSQITADAAARKRSTVPAEGSASYKVGIDIGSTTIKVVVLDAEEQIVLFTNITPATSPISPPR